MVHLKDKNVSTLVDNLATPRKVYTCSSILGHDFHCDFMFTVSPCHDSSMSSLPSTPPSSDQLGRGINDEYHVSTQARDQLRHTLRHYPAPKVAACFDVGEWQHLPPGNHQLTDCPRRAACPRWVEESSISSHGHGFNRGSTQR